MRTRAALGGHPVHAMLVHFPLAFLVGAFTFDAVTIVMRDPSYGAVAGVLLAVGVVTGVVAAVPGVVDLLASVPKGRAERTAIVHAVLSVLALAVFGVAWVLRADTGASPGVIALSLEGVGTAVLLVGGRVGATLVLDHHIGASAAPR
jgi:uncharacterized membrane protein